ncbi:hypothetical protein GCM10009416_11660 [Craurococcus roseus]|uniref:MmeI-like target recognition domain-containing protein n=1 Tax=Craurococcus roseus TaxID=77585 RepID=A0ABP3PX44_9PROT
MNGADAVAEAPEPATPEEEAGGALDRQPLYWVKRDEEWSVKGAAVRVALVCFAAADEPCVAEPVLDGHRVDRIHPNLRVVDDADVRRLTENRGVAFQGVKEDVCRPSEGPAFKLSGTEARAMLRELGNPNGRPNSDVVRPYWDGEDVTERPSDMWIVDFGPTMEEAEARGYAVPFSHVQRVVYPFRANNRAPENRRRPWRFGRARGDLRTALVGKARCVVRSETSRQPVFGWMDTRILPSGSLVVVAADDDLTFGLLHSRAHAVWTEFMGNRMGAGNDQRYNHRRTFETFPFPAGLAPTLPLAERMAAEHAAAIAEGAAALEERRRAVLFPEGTGAWMPADADPTDPRPVAPGSAVYPDRFVPDPAYAAQLAELTLAGLYAGRDAWLVDLHAKLDRAVHAAYGWPGPTSLTDDDLLDRLLVLNRERAAAGPPPGPDDDDDVEGTEAPEES